MVPNNKSPTSHFVSLWLWPCG